MTKLGAQRTRENAWLLALKYYFSLKGIEAACEKQLKEEINKMRQSHFITRSKEESETARALQRGFLEGSFEKNLSGRKLRQLAKSPILDV